MQWGGGGGWGGIRCIMVYVKMVNIEKRKDPGDEVRKDSQPSSKFESSSLFKRLSYLKVTEKCGSPAPAWRFNPLKCSTAASLYFSRAAPGGYK